jgi:hypothetical protein
MNATPTWTTGKEPGRPNKSRTGHKAKHGRGDYFNNNT